MQKYKMIDEMQEMKKIYEMMIFEDTKYEPNITNDETNNVSDCGEFEDGSMIFEDTKYEPNITNDETNVLDCEKFDDGSNSRTSCIDESICHNETDNEYDNEIHFRDG